MKTCTLFLFGAFAALLSCQQQPDAKKQYARFLNSHPYHQREQLLPEEIRQMPKYDRPDLAWEQNFLATMNPATGRPEPEKLIPLYGRTLQLTKSKSNIPGSSASPWVERGPNNFGGRTRALMPDPNDPSGNKFWAGGVTGGLWYINDITDPNASWTSVDDFWDNLSITALAYDPTNPHVFYASTGEGWFQSVSGTRGAGVWKSTDGGVTWSHLPSTSSFYFINDMVVRNEGGSGVVYLGLNGENHQGQVHGTPNIGLQRSTDGGNSWLQVLPNIPGENEAFAVADLEIAFDNRIWLGTAKSSSDLTDRGGGRLLYSDNGTSWNVERSVADGERVEVGCAPNNANYVYVMTEIGNGIGDMVMTSDQGLSWSVMTHPDDADNGIPATDFSRNQAWYDMIVAVDPNDPQTVIVGAVDLFRTTDKGLNWQQISKWSNNNNLAGLSCSMVHADQHEVIFKGGSSNEVVFGNDGGVFYTTRIAQAASLDVIEPRNNNLNIAQFYACALHPTAGSTYALAGSQDNGTHEFTVAGTGPATEVTGGDGGYCFISQKDPSIRISSYTYNWYYVSTGSWFSNVQSDRTGRFINPADYDDNLDILFSARDTFQINRITDVSGFAAVDSFAIPGMTSMASHLRVSPYTTSATTLFVGCENGDVFKVSHAESASPLATNISAGLPLGNISCIETGADEDELLVTLSNYGVTSVWYSTDGGVSWVSKEGDLPDMPVRWALFNPLDRTEVILATEVGVWSTSDFNTTSPSWSPSNSGLANVRVDMLQIRASDKMVIAATHGRGLFESNGFNPNHTSTDDVKEAYRVELFPNPTSHTVNLYFDSYGEANLQLEVFTPDGKRMLQKWLPKAARTEEQIDMENWPAGLYFIQVRGRKRLFSEAVEKR